MTVGSLYWDERPHRRRWRRDRLRLGEARDLRLPIRYGRLSTTRGLTYTMVFSQEVDGQSATMGTGKVIPCRQRLQDWEQIVSEATHLWASESNTEASSGSVSDAWGCAALLLNPDADGTDELARSWRRHVFGRPGFGRLDSADEETSIVTQSGLLAISWPRHPDGSTVDLDVLMAAATKAEIVAGRYPSSRTIADAWISGSRHSSYFWNNRKHGITTFQDAEIESILNGEASYERPSHRRTARPEEGRSW